MKPEASWCPQAKPGGGFGTGGRAPWLHVRAGGLVKDWHHLPQDYWPRPSGASPDRYSKQAPGHVRLRDTSKR